MAIQFLFPTSRQFPHDEVCSQIVTALAERNFEVPGLRVTLRTYGSGEQRMRHVASIDADDLHLQFGRRQGALPGYVDVAAVSDVRIPELALSVFDDESGPQVHTYVGDDWARDRAEFLRGWLVSSRPSDRTRTYLSYCGRGYGGLRAYELKHDGRECDLAAGDPATLSTGSVMARVRAYLVDEVLPRILAYPVVEHRADLTAPPAEIPVPADAPSPLFCLGSAQDARRIRAGRGELPPADRYGKAQGWRLVPLGTRGGSALPEVVHDGFVWCGIGDGAPAVDPARTSAVALPAVPGYHESYDDSCVLRVHLASARGVYVADHGAWVAARAALLVELAAAEARGEPRRDRLTQAEVDELCCARARTLVPLVDYRGGYAEPVVLVGRELTLDEVEVMTEEARPCS